MIIPDKNNHKEIIEFFGLPEHTLIVGRQTPVYVPLCITEYSSILYANDIMFDVSYNNIPQNPNNNLPTSIRFYNNHVIIFFRKDGKFSRNNLPSIIEYHALSDGKYVKRYEAYYINGKLHNSIGPAVIDGRSIDGKGDIILNTSYWIDGKFFTEDNFFKLLKNRLDYI